MNPRHSRPERRAPLIALVAVAIGSSALAACGGGQSGAPVARAETIAAPKDARPPIPSKSVAPGAAAPAGATSTPNTTTSAPRASAPASASETTSTSTAATAVTNTTTAPAPSATAIAPPVESVPVPAKTSIAIDGGTATLAPAEGRKDALCLVVEGTSLGPSLSTCSLTKLIMEGVGLATVNEDPTSHDLAVIGFAPPRLYRGIRVGARTVELQKGFYKTVLSNGEKQVRLVRGSGSIDSLQVRA